MSLIKKFACNVYERFPRGTFLNRQVVLRIRCLYFKTSYRQVRLTLSPCLYKVNNVEMMTKEEAQQK